MHGGMRQTRSERGHGAPSRDCMTVRRRVTVHRRNAPQEVRRRRAHILEVAQVELEKDGFTASLRLQRLDGRLRLLRAPRGHINLGVLLQENLRFAQLLADDVRAQRRTLIVSFPTPVLPPVTSTTLPVMSGTS
jgi:hypothetical protein